MMCFLAAIHVLSAAGQTASPASDFNPAFVGYLNVGQENYFALAPKPGAAPTWVRAHEAFEHWTIGNFDERSETLSLRAEGQQLNLKLNGGATSGEAEPSATQLLSAEVLALVRHEIKRRDGWTDTARLNPTATRSGDFQFIVINRSALGTERRIVLVDGEGRLKSYRTLPGFSGLPILQPFTAAIKRTPILFSYK
jgi:hypothetical protein